MYSYVEVLFRKRFGDEVVIELCLPTTEAQ